MNWVERVELMDSELRNKIWPKLRWDNERGHKGTRVVGQRAACKIEAPR